MLRHPCFDEKAHKIVGRVHLPVAPKCNIKCAFCERKIGNICEHRPGVSKNILSPMEAVEYVKKAVAIEPRIEIVGIAGPGDPLANEETFLTLKQIKAQIPNVKLCLATNGLALPENISHLLEAGVEFLTVTVNFSTPVTGAKILRFVKAGKETLYGEQAADFLLSCQIEGISLATKAGIRVKVNTVLIPEVNEHEIPEIAKLTAEAGAQLMNIIPLIPLGEFRGWREPTKKELVRARSSAVRYLPQFCLCKRCRADAVGIPGLGDSTLEAFCGLGDSTLEALCV